MQAAVIRNNSVTKKAKFAIYCDRNFGLTVLHLPPILPNGRPFQFLKN